MANVRGTKRVGERTSTRSPIFEEFVPSSGWTEESNGHYLPIDLPEQNLHEKSNEESSKKDAAEHEKGHECSTEKKEMSETKSHVKSFSKECIEKWEDEDSAFKTAMKMVWKNKKILITAVVAFSLGVLVSRKHKSIGH